MKILESKIMLAAQNSSEQMDLMLKEESKAGSLGTTSKLSGNRLNSVGVSRNGLPVIVVDRVSISQTNQVEYQSTYSGSLASRSVVKSGDTGETRVFNQNQLLETIVGGVIDKKVVIRKIGRGENINIDQAVVTSSQSAGSSSTLSQMSGETIVALRQTDIHFEAEQMNFTSTGEIVTEDGTIIKFSLDLSMDRAFLSKTHQESIVHTWQEQVVLTDPLVISLDGSLPQLSDTSFEFDLDNDGDLEKINFVSSGSGFLALDKNGDQKINNGSELFGPGTGNGFDELAAWDEDKNGWIDENDAVFSKLSVWTKDENGEDQLISLKDAGLGAIYLESAVTSFDMTGQDNDLKGKLQSSGIFLFENGKVGSIQQIDLAARSIESKKIDLPLNQAVNNLPPVSLALKNSSPVSFPVPRGVPLNDQPVLTPLETLVEQVKALRDEMELILGQNSDFSGLSRLHRGWVGKRESVFSNYQFSQVNKPDIFFLLSDGKKMGQNFYA
ncbi:MAG: hypothetical protein GY710_10255 [Desulfobacteraceae bacterium]|nr:hypothetical protein [Desulfobacteraceae bacterium]